ncbi:farnesol dehydrogenase [Bombyx mori]|uniref:Alcohol dehydrogenase n=1 Tax=Bombyx mori TaxID=7091 RepID=A0A8R2AJJ1_BOMMO|nr:farnesol dehydrogenase-like [Bombyx mori]
MDHWKNKAAIVTGAGQGIGAQITEDLIKAGMTVIGFEPTQAKLTPLFNLADKYSELNNQLIPCKCDISNDNDLKNAFEGIVKLYGGVDLLVNNAAIGKAGMISTGNLEDLNNVIDVNIYGLIACSRHAIDSMKNKGKGHIVNVNSICGHYMPSFSEPVMNVYIASKRSMTVFTKTLREELKMINSKIKITSVSPGIVKTGIFKSAGVGFIDDAFFCDNSHLTVKDVSEVILMILSSPRTVNITEIIFRGLHSSF